MFALQHAVVRDPAQGNLSERQAVLLRGSLDGLQCAEVRVVPVAAAIALRARVSHMT